MLYLLKHPGRRNFVKHSLLCSILCVLCTVNLFADNPVSVKSGDVSVLRRPSKALLEFDYSATKVGDQTLDEYLQGRGDDFVRDWSQDRETAASYFKRYFKGMKLFASFMWMKYKGCPTFRKPFAWDCCMRS